MLKVPIQKPNLVISCTITVPKSVLAELKLNCANLYQSNDPKQRARAMASDKRAQKQRLSQTDPARFKQIVQTVKNADDNQFKFDCFDGKKTEQSDMAFMSIVRSYNKKYKDQPITKATLVNAIKQLSSGGYRSSKIMQSNPKYPTPYDNLWCHEWHVPLSTVFGKHADEYEWDYGDEIYFKLVFTSEPKANGKYDNSKDIHVASFHRDSDSAFRDDSTGKKTSWWSDDTDDEEERESMRKSGLEARNTIKGFKKDDTATR